MMEQHKSTYPAAISFLGPDAVMTRSESMPQPLEKPKTPLRFRARTKVGQRDANG